MGSSRAPIVCFLCLVIVSLISAPGCGMFASTDGVIDQVIESGNSYRSEMVTPTGKFSDFLVYRKPDTDVVVYEHKMKPGLQVDKAIANSIEFKTDLVSQLNNTASIAALDSGISFEFLYIDANGVDICRHSVTSEDF